MNGLTRLLRNLALSAVVGMLAASPVGADYQTDRLDFGSFNESDGSPAAFPVTEFQYDVRFNQSATCTDDETCDGPVRDMGTFTWFTPITLEIGNAQGIILYGLHGGPARGGSRWRDEGITSWYIDWSGHDYWGNSLIDPETGWTHKPHELDSLVANRWYRIRVSRFTCELENSAFGKLWRMQAWHRSGTTWEYLGNAGIWCLPSYASTITGAYAFIEIIENEPCETDFNFADMRNFRYRDASGKWKFIDEADAEYGGANEAQCTDTNWRRLSDNSGWMRNIREQIRGKYGGLKLPPGDDYGEVGAWD